MNDAAAGKPSEFGLPRILAIDDDSQVRGLLRRLLERSGYAVEEAATAEEGLESIRANPPDLVFLDLHLPDRSGHSVLEEIRSNPETRLLPVVMLTGFRIVGREGSAPTSSGRPTSSRSRFPSTSFSPACARSCFSSNSPTSTSTRAG